MFLDIGIPFDENGDGDIDSDDENPQGRRKQSKSKRKSGVPNMPPTRGEVDPGPSPGPAQQSEPRKRQSSIHSSCELYSEVTRTALNELSMYRVFNEKFASKVI